MSTMPEPRPAAAKPQTRRRRPDIAGLIAGTLIAGGATILSGILGLAASGRN
jgi:hypothetical protein